MLLKFQTKNGEVVRLRLSADIADYLGWFNTHRPHSSLERLTPHEKHVPTLPQMKLAA